MHALYRQTGIWNLLFYFRDELLCSPIFSVYKGDCHAYFSICASRGIKIYSSAPCLQK